LEWKTLAGSFWHNSSRWWLGANGHFITFGSEAVRSNKEKHNLSEKKINKNILHLRKKDMNLLEADCFFPSLFPQYSSWSLCCHQCINCFFALLNIIGLCTTVPLKPLFTYTCPLQDPTHQKIKIDQHFKAV
jgi:hypothetical protein